MIYNTFDLKGKTVLVTGATGYLGRTMCFGLASNGAHVLVNSRKTSRADALVREIIDKGGKAESAAFDVTSKQEVSNYFSSYEGRLNILINNAYSGRAGTIESVDNVDVYRDSYKSVVESAHNLVQASLPLLRTSVQEQGDASVINIASMYAMVSPDLRVYESPNMSNPPFYGAAKAAIIQWTKYGACEFGHEGIRFNSISPGPFPNVDTNTPEFIAQLARKVPLNRVGKATEIAGPVVFLASEASSYVNGTNLVVDGGWTAW